MPKSAKTRPSYTDPDYEEIARKQKFQPGMKVLDVQRQQIVTITKMNVRRAIMCTYEVDYEVMGWVPSYRELNTICGGTVVEFFQTQGFYTLREKDMLELSILGEIIYGSETP
jgi:hypothetical protein